MVMTFVLFGTYRSKLTVTEYYQQEITNR